MTVEIPNLSTHFIFQFISADFVFFFLEKLSNAAFDILV